MMLSKLLNGMKQHPVVTFFALAYVISWGTFFILGGPFLFPFGPFLAALIMASVTGGWGGLKELASRCLRWRVGLKWYAAALFVPAAIALATVASHILLGAPMPTAAQLGPWYSLFLLFPVAMIDAPLAEETGWRGYALPRFPAGRSPLANTLILAVLVAGWHVPIALSGGSLAVPYLLAAIASAVVTNWVYYNARESALFAILYHTAANTIGMYLFSMFPDSDLGRLYWLLAAVNWLVAVILVLVAGSNLVRTPAQPEAAIEPVAGI
jgi:membrane protease YdiL (CAAX protease family)